jgi:Tol biopolymer transport system component
MSPEQLFGKRVDARSDVYSAGVCLYELATARKPYGERSGASLTDAILHEVPGLASLLNAKVPKGLDSVIAKAMDKDPELRYQSAGELLVDLERLQQGSEAGASTEARGRGRAGSASWWRRPLPRAVGVGLAVLVAAAAVILGWPPRPPRLHGSRAVTRGLSTTADPGWASDGTRLYYSETRKGVTKYYQAPLAGGEPSEIPIPFPFGHILAYLPRQGALLVNGSDAGSFPVEGPPLWLVSVPSGAVRRIGDLKAWQAAVSPDEQRLALVYRSGREGRIAVAKADGSDLRELLKLPAGRKSWVAWAPDGERLRFGSTGPAGHEDEEWIWEMSVRGERPRPLWRGGVGHWTPDGRHFIFARPQGAQGRSDLWAARDKSWLPGPRPSPVQLSFGPMSLFSPGFGPDGRQLYAWGDVLRGELLRYDARTQRLESYLGGVSGHFADASPDAQWVAFVTYPEAELWKCRPDGSQRVQLSRPGTAAAYPRWSPDGREIAFFGLEPGDDRFSLRRVSGGGGGEEVLARLEPAAYFSDACWLPEGEGLVFGRPFAGNGIFKLDLRTKQISLLPGAGNLMQSICSRQGDVLAWQETPKPTYRILRHGRTEWEDVDSHSLAYPNWTRDGEAIIGLKLEGQRVERFDLKTPQWTTVVNLAETPLVMSDYGSWMGLSADDSPVIMRERGTRDLYALDWETP